MSRSSAKYIERVNSIRAKKKKMKNTKMKNFNTILSWWITYTHILDDFKWYESATPSNNIEREEEKRELVIDIYEYWIR